VGKVEGVLRRKGQAVSLIYSEIKRFLRDSGLMISGREI